VEIDYLPSSSERILRVVKPYLYTYATFVKQRWIGRQVLEVYANEFGSFPKAYYSSAILEGRILVSGRLVDPEYALKSGEEVTHTVHRHEPAVSIYKPPNSVRILYESDTLLAVEKPATIPVHPCGGYNFNSIFHYLAEEFPRLKDHLFTVHRLDRLTSGVLIIAKTSTAAQELGKCIMDRDCEKLYLARVRGKFPTCAPPDKRWNTEELPVYGQINQIEGGIDAHELALGYWITNDDGERLDAKTAEDVFNSRTQVNDLVEITTPCKDSIKAKTEDMLWIHLACPTRISAPKTGKCAAGPVHLLNPKSCARIKKTIKPAQTSFSVLHYDSESDTTIVLAKPVTGRTHQIRLHLKYLGHVIANDVSYGGDMHFGDDIAREKCAAAKVEMDSMEFGSDAVTTDAPATKEEIRELSMFHREEGETLIKFITRTCVWCKRNGGIGHSKRSMLEFLVRSRGIWLHALQYTFKNTAGEKRTFCTQVPSWSLLDHGGLEPS